MDGIPNVILEAFALETPVISTQLSGIPEVVREAETGRLVPPADAEALADAIRRVLRDPAPHAEFARRGRALIADRFSLQRNVRGFLETILGDTVEAGKGLQARVAN
jgi:glycosyltransferase involved in cell wall biosynthesis